MNHPTPQVRRSSHSGLFTHPIDTIFRTASGPGNLIQFPKYSSEQTSHKLILTLEGNIIREYSINTDNLTIGRRHGNDIQLNDLTLSRHHAHFYHNSCRVYVEDLGSTNGTLVNGCQVKKAVLKHGDVIQTGNHQLTYHCNYENPPTISMFVKTEHDKTTVIGDKKAFFNDQVKCSSLGGLQVTGRRNALSVPVMELHKKLTVIGFRGKRMAEIKRGTGGYTITAITGNHSRRAHDIPLLNKRHLGGIQNQLQPGDLITIAVYDIRFNFLD